MWWIRFLRISQLKFSGQIYSRVQWVLLPRSKIFDSVLSLIFFLFNPIMNCNNKMTILFWNFLAIIQFCKAATALDQNRRCHFSNDIFSLSDFQSNSSKVHEQHLTISWKSAQENPLNSWFMKHLKSLPQIWDRQTFTRITWNFIFQPFSQNHHAHPVKQLWRSACGIAPSHAADAFPGAIRSSDTIWPTKFSTLSLLTS